MWASFTPAEMARRWDLARRLMDRHDLRALLLFGNSGVNRHNQANVFWLSNHLDLHHAYLLAPRDEAIEPALYTGLGNHVPDARRIAQVPVVAWGGHDPAATVAERLRATGITRGRPRSSRGSAPRWRSAGRTTSATAGAACRSSPARPSCTMPG
ncbi:MAG TPA: hypothetical protein VF880_14955, partial [Actinomycetes bacterium]